MFLLNRPNRVFCVAEKSPHLNSATLICQHYEKEISAVQGTILVTFCYPEYLEELAWFVTLVSIASQREGTAMFVLGSVYEAWASPHGLDQEAVADRTVKASHPVLLCS